MAGFLSSLYNYFYNYFFIKLFTLILPQGVLIGTTNKLSIAMTDALKRYNFNYKNIIPYNYADYLKVIDQVSKLHIFFGNLNTPQETKVVNLSSNDQYVKLNDLIAITTIFYKDLFSTSFERVSNYNRFNLASNDIFTITLSTASQNIIDGYYTFTFNYDKVNNLLEFQYIKTQKINTPLWRLFNSEENYIKNSKESVVNSLNNLLGLKLTTNDVEHLYE
jgi:hypothetical protein